MDEVFRGYEAANKVSLLTSFNCPFDLKTSVHGKTSVDGLQEYLCSFSHIPWKLLFVCELLWILNIDFLLQSIVILSKQSSYTGYLQRVKERF